MANLGRQSRAWRRTGMRGAGALVAVTVLAGCSGAGDPDAAPDVAIASAPEDAATALPTLEPPAGPATEPDVIAAATRSIERATDCEELTAVLVGLGSDSESRRKLRERTIGELMIVETVADEKQRLLSCGAVECFIEAAVAAERGDGFEVSC